MTTYQSKTTFYRQSQCKTMYPANIFEIENSSYHSSSYQIEHYTYSIRSMKNKKIDENRWPCSLIIPLYKSVVLQYLMHYVSNNRIVCLSGFPCKYWQAYFSVWNVSWIYLTIICVVASLSALFDNRLVT